MGERIVGISGFSFTEKQKNRLYAEAKTFGLQLREVPHKSTEPHWVLGCEALAGDYEISAIEAAKDMRWFHSDWAGVDKLVHLSAFRERCAILTNSAGAYGIMVAEYMLAGCLMLLRHFHDYLDAQRKHIWLDALPAESLWGKRITVLGVGSNGGCFARMANSLGAKVSGIDALITERPEWLEKLYPVRGLWDALADTEILVMCLPYTKDTDKIIGEKEIRRLPKGSFIINSGRGQTLDERALARALQDGHLGGAMLDVFPGEPLSEDDPLWDARNLIISPHISGFAADRLNTERVFEIFVENLRRWSRGDPLNNVVNLEKGY